MTACIASLTRLIAIITVGQPCDPDEYGTYVTNFPPGPLEDTLPYLCPPGSARTTPLAREIDQSWSSLESYSHPKQQQPPYVDCVAFGLFNAVVLCGVWSLSPLCAGYGNSLDPQDQSSRRCVGACPAGFFCPEGTIEPSPCRVGTYCRTGSVAEATCKDGTYGTKPQRVAPEDCPTCEPGGYCTRGIRILCTEVQTDWDRTR